MSAAASRVRVASVQPITLGRKMFRKRCKEQSQAAIARITGLSPQHVWSLYNGERSPGLQVAFLLEDKLGIPARSWLLEAPPEEIPT